MMNSESTPPAPVSNTPCSEIPAPRSAPWSDETRRWVVIGLVIAGAVIVYQISETLAPLVLALLLAYLLNPLVNWVQHRWRMSRLLAVALVYLALIVLLITAFAALVPVLFRQLVALILGLDKILEQTSVALRQIPLLAAFGFQPDSHLLADQLRNELASLRTFAPRLVMGAASGVFSAVFVLVLSFYLLKDAETIDRNIVNAVPENYRDEVRRIKAELNAIWSSFLRGQIILAIIIGTLTSVVLAVLGVPNALFLGLLAGLLEVVPNVGPIIAMIPAVLIAFFQGSTVWTIDNTVFAVIVVIAYILIQQLENHLIVPNVLGSSVNLPAVVVLFGAFAGASLAGVLGIFLAAPVLATARAIGGFVLRKLLEPGAR